MTYEEAVQMYTAKYPGRTISGSAGQDAFNVWSGQTFGSGGYEAAAFVPPTNTAASIFGAGTAGAANNTLGNAAVAAGSNPNSTQVQGAVQNGGFESTGASTTSGTQTQQGRNTTTGNQTVAGTQTNTGVQTGNQSGTQTGNATTNNTTTGQTNVVDTLGLGGLLAGSAGSATNRDQVSNDFLTGLVKDGPKNQQALTDRAVSQSLSGPGMVGTGDGAKVRAASDAAATVGVNSLNQQLAASQQLSGPTATTTLAQAGRDYLGQQTTGQNTGNQTTTGTTDTSTVGRTSGTQANNQSTDTNTLNLSDLINNTSGTTSENQSGTSNNSGITIGSGNIPETKQQSSGGCYVTTAYVNMGWRAKRCIRAAAKWKLDQPKYRRSLVGYSLWGPTAARWVLDSGTFAALLFPVARAVLYEELRLAGKTKSTRLSASLCHAVFHYGSLALAKLTGVRKIRQCDDATVDLLSRNGLLFDCHELT